VKATRTDAAFSLLKNLTILPTHPKDYTLYSLRRTQTHSVNTLYTLFHLLSLYHHRYSIL
jgi:hypothetical protein